MMLALKSAVSVSRPAVCNMAATTFLCAKCFSSADLRHQLRSSRQERSLYSSTKPSSKSTVGIAASSIDPSSITTQNPAVESTAASASPPPIPEYLTKVYWWAYLHPNAVWFFERQWLVDAILWGNFKMLRDTALEELVSAESTEITGNTLQLACVYGDFTQLVAKRLADNATLHVVDVAPIQLENLKRKMKASTTNPDNVILSNHNAADLSSFQKDTFNQVILFFLLHEMPANVRTQTLKEVMRVMKPGGKLVLVDYHKPSSTFPLRGVMHVVLSTLEPFALDLWKNPVATWLPTNECVVESNETYFGGLYQKVIITKNKQEGLE